MGHFAARRHGDRDRRASRGDDGARLNVAAVLVGSVVGAGLAAIARRMVANADWRGDGYGCFMVASLGRQILSRQLERSVSAIEDRSNRANERLRVA